MNPRFKSTINSSILLWLITTGVRPMTPTPTIPVTSLDLQKERMDIERLKLENENLKLELEKARLQAIPQATVLPSNDDDRTKERTEKVLKGYQQEVSNKARDLSVAHKDEENLLVIDFVNSEFWYKGIRYSLHEFYSIEEGKVKIRKQLDERLSNGTPRYRYSAKNAVLLRYESRDRGTFEISAPQKPDDFKMLTPEGITLESEVGELRNAYQGIYFRYEGMGETDGFKTIRYQHSHDLLTFGDKLEFLVTREGKIHKIRYGALDER